MKKEECQGFTIIETMLFLAITGLLVMSILVGSTSAIGRQRYRDSVNDLHSFLQEQYSSVLNTSNQRDNTFKCDASGVVSVPADGDKRGQTDCVLLGKFIKITSVNSDKLEVMDVYGYSDNPEEAAKLDEVKVFYSPSPGDYSYSVKALPNSKKEYHINWGVKVFSKEGEVKKSFSLLIVRSPNSGNILTFFKKVAVPDNSVGELLVDRDNLKEGVICLDPDGLLPGSDRVAIRFDSRAAGSGGVSLINPEGTACQ